MKEEFTISDLITRDGMPEIQEGHLSLSNKGLTDIDNLGCIKGVQNVRTLDLSGNRLKKLEQKIFDGLFALEHLDLSHNNLTTLEIPQKLMKVLKSINVTGNQLESWPIAMLAKRGVIIISDPAAMGELCTAVHGDCDCNSCQ